MNRLKLHCLQRQTSDLPDDNDRQSTLSTISSDSNHSLVSSLISSVCELSGNLNDYLLKSDDPSITNNDEKRSLTNNIFLCKICRKFDSFNQSKVCLRCRENQLLTKSDSLLDSLPNEDFDSQRERSQSLQVDCIRNKNDKLSIEDENKRNRDFDNRSTKVNQQKQPSIDSFSNSSYTSTQSCLNQLLLQPKFPIKIEPTLSVKLSPERLDYCKQRQIELDRVVNNLLESLARKNNENIRCIEKYWSYLKQISLEQYQPKTSHFQSFADRLKSPDSKKQLASFLEANEEIEAALQILSTILTLVHEKYSFATISRLFDDEEKTMLENLHHQCESLHSAYADELSFIHSRIHYYQSCSDGEKNFDWIQSIKVEYPILTEKICDDFILKVPQIEKILLQMLRSMKKRLLNVEITVRRETM